MLKLPRARFLRNNQTTLNTLFFYGMFSEDNFQIHSFRLIMIRAKIIQVFLIGCAVFFGLLGMRLHTIIETEEAIVDFIVAQMDLDDLDDSEVVREATLTLGHFLSPRRVYSESVFDYRADVQTIHNSPITTVILNGGGACGFSSELGVRVFQRLGFRPRFVQVLNAQNKTSHVVMDACRGDTYAVIDPIFGHVHLNADGQFASLDDLQFSWQDIRQGLPDDTKISSYSYEYGVRFTNWNRLGWMAAPVKFMLKSIGMDTGKMSLRIWFNQIRRILPYVYFSLSGLSLILVMLFVGKE